MNSLIPLPIAYETNRVSLQTTRLPVSSW